MSKRILVVEDQEDNLQILRDLLTSAGFEVIEAKDGEEGVRAAVAECPDLILMDIQLPLLDDYDDTPHQGRSSVAGDSDHRRHFVCFER